MARGARDEESGIGLLRNVQVRKKSHRRERNPRSEMEEVTSSQYDSGGRGELTCAKWTMFEEKEGARPYL